MNALTSHPLLFPPHFHILMTLFLFFLKSNLQSINPLSHTHIHEPGPQMNIRICNSAGSATTAPSIWSHLNLQPAVSKRRQTGRKNRFKCVFVCVLVCNRAANVNKYVDIFDNIHQLQQNY